MMRRLILLSLMLLISIPLMVAPVKGQLPNVTEITLYLEDFTQLARANHPDDLPPPITFANANFFTHPDHPWITLQIGHGDITTSPQPNDATAIALKNETLTADGGIGYATGYTAWRTPVVGSPPTAPTNGDGTADGKVEILIEPHKLLNTPIFQVADIVDIRWDTYRISDASGGNDWYASIWGESDTARSLPPIANQPPLRQFISLINFESRYTPSYQPPVTGDPIHNVASTIRPSEHFYAATNISGVAGVSLNDIRNGAIDWGDFFTSGSTQIVDYRNHDVKAIAFATGSSWAYQLDSYLDNLQIDIETAPGVIETIIINLEVRAPVYISTPYEDGDTISMTTPAGVETRETVTITNEGTANLIINSITSASANELRLSYNLPITPFIAPGDTYEIDFICGGTSYLTTGTYTGTALVTQNGLGAPTVVQYDMECIITDPPAPIYSSVPAIGATINFDESNLTQNISISNTGNADLQVYANVSDNTQFGTSTPTLTIPPTETANLVVSCLHTAIGSYTGTLQVQHNDPALSNPIIYDLACDLATNPPIFVSDPPAGTFTNPMIWLFNTPANTARQWPIDITNTGGSDLIIDRIETSHPTVFTFTPNNFTLAEGETQAVEGVCLSDTVGRYDVDVHIYHNASGSPATFLISCVVDEPTAPSPLIMLLRDNNSNLVLSQQTIANEVDRLYVHFSNFVFDDGTGDDPDSASNPANYILLEGWDISTTSCSAGISPDDTQIHPSNIEHNASTARTTLHFDPSLGAGQYSLIVCGSTSIVSASDPTIRLGNGSDTITRFAIDPEVIEPEPQPTTPPTDSGTTDSAPATTPLQPEDLDVTQLPATGETPIWAELLRRIFGW